MVGEYAGLVPQDEARNLMHRQHLLDITEGDVAVQQEVWNLCARDIGFWIDSFVWTYDPRKTPPVIPMVLYGFQRDALKRMEDGLGNRDLLLEKSRDLGASWLSLLFVQHQWLYVPMFTGLCVSRKEDLVDKRGNPDSLFAKLDFVLDRLPLWMAEKDRTYDRKLLHFRNKINGATIDGESTTGDVARGGRRTIVLLDEFAAVENGHQVLRATRDVTKTRFFVSTPKGVGNAFYDVRSNAAGVEIITLHWTQHPEKAAGLYYDEDGKPRSPWYDEQCARAAHPQEIAQELDIDYLSSDFQFFASAKLKAAEKECARPAVRQGEWMFDHDGEVVGWMDQPGGRWKLWFNPGDPATIPSQGRYVFGCDIAAGTGSSNSAGCMLDRVTGEQVAEFVDSHITPHDFADLAVSVCRLFVGQDYTLGGAFLIWEANGAGRLFGRRVEESGYYHYFLKRDEKTLNRRTSQIPGWYTTVETKLLLLGSFRKALQEGDLILRSDQLFAEAQEYIYTQNGRVEHSRSVVTIDPSGARDNHGDRVIAGALAWQGCGEQVKPDEQEEIVDRDEERVGSLAWRRDINKQRQRQRIY